MKDPNFLRTILPISLELDALLRRIFEFNPAKRATIPEIREMILRCSGFSASKSAVSSPLPSPPFSPVDYTRDAAFNNCYQAVPSVAPLPGPAFFQHSTSSGSSNSDNESVFSSCSSASSTSSTSSYQNVSPSPTQHFSIRVPQQQYVSPPAPANTWFQPFIQAANLVKHVSFQPSMMAQPVRVY